MGLTLKHERRGSVLVVELGGELDIYTVERFRRVVSDVGDEAPVVVDLRDVDLVDSSGLGALLSLAQPGEGPREVALVCKGQTIPRLLELTRLTEQFTLAPTVDDAVQSLSPPPAA